MRSIQVEAKQKHGVEYFKYSSSQPPFSSFQTPSDGNISNENEATTTSSSSPSSLSRISPLILLVIIVLAVIFFVYGLVHLVLWFLMKRPTPQSLYNSNNFTEATRTRALQRQLQQLFRLHDSGLDQALIDALPVFYYHDLLGLKEPFDCAVCLCEFSDQDKLRLLPMCSHAFHMNCLDTWLLSNSTCPLCRACLSNSGFYVENPIFNIDNSLVMPNRLMDEEENGCSDSQRSVTGEAQISGKRVFSVRLGKFRNNGLEGGVVGGVIGDSSSCSLDERRCYSMGSYQYVVRDSNLQIVLSQSHDVLEHGNVEGKRIGNSTQGESFSVSKIWLWSKKTKFHSSNAAFP
ncbi:RING-H2 finger protein ATL46-like [Abrus precatorius]|uniref:RING-type E3 ubiquitin transferase n=1 Tax=Abrus precatorius TaxID=3816 RepID=A0A8B8JEL3_ABRPR|nr:RING-H2 finger protein ATL46-like [Abrus precatorius]